MNGAHDGYPALPASNADRVLSATKLPRVGLTRTLTPGGKARQTLSSSGIAVMLLLAASTLGRTAYQGEAQRYNREARAGEGTHCVDASSAPSGLNAAAMVERGGGDRSQ